MTTETETEATPEEALAPEPAKKPPVTDSLARLTPRDLALLRPNALSRWSARIFVFGETRYAEHENKFQPGAPLVIRTPASIGSQFAETCEGVPIIYGNLRTDGLRAGSVRFTSASGVSEMVYFVNGYIEQAVADDFGLVASIMLLSTPAHRALLDLDAHDALADAMLCLSHDVEVTLSKTRWALPVADVTSACATMLDMTSQGHTPGTRILRRLEPDEPLNAGDFRVRSRLYIPDGFTTAAVEGATAHIDVGTVGTLELTNQAVTTGKRQILGSTTQAYVNVPPSTNVTVTGLSHGLGVKPLITTDSGNVNFFVQVSNVTNTTFDLSVFNAAGTNQSGTVTIYFM